jgi:predicted DNA-binding transcriptional regulator AlpA
VARNANASGSAVDKRRIGQWLKDFESRFAEDELQRKRQIMKIEKDQADKLLTRHKIADLLGVSKETIRQYERRGLLSVLPLTSRTLRYRQNDVDALLQRRLNNQRN